MSLSHSRLSPVMTVSGVLLLVVTTAYAAGTPEQQCQAGKNKTAGKYAACRENAEAKLAASGDMGKYNAAITKCGDKFAAAWQKLEAKAVAAGTTCPSVGDVTGIGDQVTATTDTVAALVGGARHADCGDGTVADRATGLMWQKTDNAGGRTDKDNVYTWTASGSEAPNGTVFTDFIAGLNGALTGTTCLAGHCDWRVPTVFELVSILLAPYPCATNPCIDQTVFGPMNASAAYHTNTSSSSFTPRLYAYTVEFTDGRAHALDLKTFPAKQVRAVRNGSCP